jgi:hypothetical protein
MKDILIFKMERRFRNLQYVYILENWFVLKTNLEERIKKLESVLNKDPLS